MVVDLKEFGVVQRALLGVQFRVVDQDFLDTEGKELGIKDLGGAYVAAVVEGGAASEAGIRKGDVILDIDGVKIVEPSTLQEQIAKRRPNDTVKLSVKRDGKVKQFEVSSPMRVPNCAANLTSRAACRWSASRPTEFWPAPVLNRDL